MQVLPVERWPKCAHLVQKHTNAPNVCLKVIGVALDDFGTEVVWSANNSCCHLSRRLQYSRDTEITKLNHSITHKEDVLCLDVTMQDLSIVAML